ncbi:MAG: UDP-3-O-(3-hydroxymyristoyl)glucosamine N-acyltransferase [Caulobacteraceae bacterium]|nr:MAG: UDP-3-O-(3-hydroxymyristoyl)glucosamine N-acyltransferase [Caulobacteraceae bacterium]
MPDPRFFQALRPLSLRQISELTGARIASGPGDLMIAEPATLDRATGAAVAFATDRKWLARLEATGAGACFVPEALVAAVPEGCIALETRHPQASWAVTADALCQPILQPPTGDWIDATAVLEADVVVGPGVVIGPGARIGQGSHIGPGVVIGPGVSIGRNCRVGPQAVIGFALIGDNVRLHAGVVIGEAGFGAAGGPTGVVDVPQFGRVILQDNVTVGSHSCIDRGAYEDTVIGENTKIDNLVHIAHNVRIGRNCLLAGFVGISGSAVIGDGVMFGGRAGLADHVEVGDGASIGAGSGIIRKVPAGEVWTGYPGRPVREFLRETAWVANAARRKGTTKS